MRHAFRPAAAVALLASPAMALTPLPPCEGVTESAMTVGAVETLGSWEGVGTGVVVESYRNAMVPEGDVYVERPAPVAELSGFYGARATQCSTGEFLAIPGEDAHEASVALAATEFLRAQVQAGEPVAFRDLRRAAEALYGPVLVMRETAQTCGCNALYDDLRPEGQTPFGQRADVEQ